jgi:hypothetical protein
MRPPLRRSRRADSGRADPATRQAGREGREMLQPWQPIPCLTEVLTHKAISMALCGDPVALRLCLERVCPPRRDRPVNFNLRPIAKALLKAKKLKAAIVVAKLDRLSRDVAFIATLMAKKVEFKPLSLRKNAG